MFPLIFDKYYRHFSRIFVRAFFTATLNKYMVRTIITPSDTDIHLSIAKEYVGKTIEITYLALDELEQKPASEKSMADFWNTISDETAQKLHDNVKQIRNEWDRDI
jgi:hypothetical protein